MLTSAVATWIMAFIIAEVIPFFSSRRYQITLIAGE